MSTVGSLLVKLGIDISEFDKGLDEAAKRSSESGSKISSGLASVGKGVVTAGLGAVVAGVTAISAAAVDGVGKTMDWAETLDGVGDVLGTSAQQSAALAVAIQGVGGDVGQMTSQMTILTRGLVDAQGKIGPTGTILEKMGIKFKDAQGNILPATDILQSVANVIGNMPDGLEKTAMMTDLFGKSGKDLSDVMGALANGGLAKADEKAKAMGLSMSDDAVNGSLALGRSMNDLKMMFDGVLMRLVSGLMPGLSQLADMLKKALADPMVQTAITNLATGIALFAQNVITNIPVVIQWITQAVEYLKNNQGIVVGVLAALGVAVGVFVWTTVIPALIAMIAAAAPVIAVMALIGAAAYLLYQAWQSDWGGIREKTQAVVDWITTNVSAFLANITAWWKQNGDSILGTARALWDGVQAVFQGFVNWFTAIYNAWKTGFSGDWHGFGVQMREVWKVAWDAITNVLSAAWNGIKTIVGNLISDVINKFQTTDWGNLGRNIIQGIANGITSAISWIVDAARRAAQAALDAARGLLGINSPSKVFTEVGHYMMAGWQLGIDQNADMPVGATLDVAGATVSGVSMARPAPVPAQQSAMQIDYDRLGHIFAEAVSRINR